MIPALIALSRRTRTLLGRLQVPKRITMRALRYALPFLFLASVPVGLALGGGWTFLAVAVLLLAICGFDGILGIDIEAEEGKATLSYRLLVWLYIPLQIAVTVWAATAVARPSVTPDEAIGLTVSTGLTAGIFGMLAPHWSCSTTSPIMACSDGRGPAADMSGSRLGIPGTRRGE
jgi:hypothetical protein